MRQRPFAGLILLACGGCGLFFTQTGSRQSLAGTTTTLVIVRHAERDAGLDPPLNATGVVRAEALADVLEEHGVTAIITADLARNRQTAQPVADRLGLSVQLLSVLNLAEPSIGAEAVLDEVLNNHAGGTVLFIGNMGNSGGIETIGINEQIFRKLGGTGEPPNRYEDMYIVVIPDEGETRFIKATYGGRSPQDP